MEANRRLLILSCSQRKRSDTHLLPAIERYNGPAFGVLRRFMRTQAAELLDTYILSAQFGLIPHNHPIPYYNLRLTRQRAEELQPDIIIQLACLLDTVSYRELCLCMGEDYLTTVAGYEALTNAKPSVTMIIGGRGKQLSALHSWLYGGPSVEQFAPIASTGRAHIRGIEIILTPAQILDIAQRSLTQGCGNPASFHAWYVPVGEQRVSPKWLVSQLTGLPVNKFHSDDARRVLWQLGIEVCFEALR
jgi:hypothetical protein